MKKINDKRVFKVATVTALVLGTISLTTCPTTNSRYWTESEKPFSYNADIYTLNKQNERLRLLTSITDDKISTEDTAYLRLNFTRNKSEFTGSILDKNTEKYTLTMSSNKCSIYSSTSSFGKWNGNVLTLAPKKSGDKVTPIPDNANGVVILACDLSEPDSNELLSKNDEGKYVLNVTVNVREQIDKEIPFNFKDYTFVGEYDPLNVEKPTPPDPVDPDIPDDAILIDANNLGEFSTFREALIYEILKSVEGLNGYTSEIRQYINSIDDDAIKQAGALKGLTLVNPNPSDGIYAFTVDNNFAGYAKTFVYKDIAEAGTFYTTGKTEEEINEAFGYYLEEYYCKEAGTINYDNAYMVLNYIKSTTGLKAFIEGNAIPGLITYESEPDAIRIGNAVLKVIAPALFTTKEIKIYSNDTFENDREIMKGTFVTAMNRIYGETVADSIISKDILESIVKDEAILSAASNTESTSPSYFARQEDGYAILIEIVPKTVSLTATIDGKVETVERIYNSITVSKVITDTDSVTIEYPNLDAKKTTETDADYEARIKADLIAKFQTEEALKIIGTVDETRDYEVELTKDASGKYTAKCIVPIKVTADTPDKSEESDKEVIDPIVNPQDEIINSMQIPEDEVGIIKDTVEPPVIENPIEEAIEEDPIKDQPLEEIEPENTPIISKEEDFIEEANSNAEVVIEEE